MLATFQSQPRCVVLPSNAQARRPRQAPLALAVVAALLLTQSVAVAEDARVKSLLDKIQLPYQTTGSGRFSVYVQMDDLVIHTLEIESETKLQDGREVRKAWSPVYQARQPLPAEAEQNLLKSNSVLANLNAGFEVYRKGKYYELRLVGTFPATMSEKTTLDMFRMVTIAYSIQNQLLGIE